jgi:hypothetical protein
MPGLGWVLEEVYSLEGVAESNWQSKGQGISLLEMDRAKETKRLGEFGLRGC